MEYRYCFELNFMLHLDHLNFVSVLAADDADFGGVGGAVVLTLVGMLVVFVSLTVLMGLVTAIKVDWARKFKPADEPSVPSPVETDEQATPDVVVKGVTAVNQPESNNDEITPELLAVITAAAVTAVKSMRPRKVKRYLGTNDAWQQQGRRSLVTGRRPVRYHN